jgi:cation/acetate symporter
VRALAVGATIIVSFTYVVAQIYAVGLIASRFTGVDFSVGIFLGLASILVCSFLGGMRAITWTQVAQYIIILVAFLIPTMWLSCQARRQSGAAGRLRFGAAQAGASAKPSWRPTRASRKCAPASASAPTNTARAWPACRLLGSGPRRGAAPARRGALRNASLGEIRSAERALIAYPKTADEAARVWPSSARQPGARPAARSRMPTPFPGAPRGIDISAATTSWRWCSA